MREIKKIACNHLCVSDINCITNDVFWNFKNKGCLLLSTYFVIKDKKELITIKYTQSTTTAWSDYLRFRR